MQNPSLFSAVVLAGALSTLVAGCGEERSEGPPVDEAPVGTSSGALACSTRITYGDRWIHPGTRSSTTSRAAW
ncbi:hypothetical protein [Corallococcus sp. 4LFB]|uniref:hypothetical protein n=1 Tax=Corallococcus sp. 4LFB TaxID=3383249 RepID=UPI003976BE08